MTDLAGGCLCGQVRYALKNPMLTLACHCTNCRRQSGAAFSMNVVVRESEIELSGRLQAYGDVGDSGQPVSRNFCPICGSPIYSAIAAMPGILAFKAGTLDEPDRVTPVAQVYCDTAVSWASLDGVAAKFARGAPADALLGKSGS